MPAPFDLVEVAPGRKLHVHLSGPADAPVAIFDHGAFGMIADGWWVKERLKRDWRVLLYARAGMGRSDPQPDDAQMTPDWHVEDLRRLTTTLGLKPPFLLIGHSMAGLRLHAYAADHGDEISGLCYIDAMHPGATVSTRGRRLLTAFNGILKIGCATASLGLMHALVALERDDIALPPELKPEKRRAFVSAAHWRAASREVAEIDHDTLAAQGALKISRPTLVFSRAANGGEHARTAHQAQAAGMFSELHAQPAQSHTSFLNPAGADAIGEAIMRMAQSW